MEKQIYRVAPFFFVADVRASAEYYERALGFANEGIYGEPAQACMPLRDGFYLNLRRAEQPGAIRPIASVGGEDLSDAYIWVRDVDALFAEFKARGARIAYEPVVKFYGMKEFGVTDLDGYLLVFGQEATEGA